MRLHLLILLYFTIGHSFGQLTNDGGVLHIQSGATVYADANIINKNTATTTNEGILKTTNDLQNNSSSTIKGNGEYYIQQDWTNAATFAKGTSKVIFFNTSNSNLTSGGNDFYDLEINKIAGNKLILLDHAIIANNLNFAADDNKLAIGNFNLTVDVSASLTGFDANEYIITGGTGQLIKNKLSSFTFPIGFDENTYNLVVLTENGTVDNIGVRCLENVFENGISGNALTQDFVSTSWSITEAVANGSNFDLECQWTTTDELTNFNRNSCGVAFYAGSAWQISSQTAATGSNPYTQSRTGLTQFGVFSVSSDNSILPLELLKFEVFKINQRDAKLEWQTAYEINASHFEIERSQDLHFWSNIGKVQASNQTSSILNYHFLDKNIPQQPSSKANFYYRLKMMDEDDTFEYSPIRNITFDNQLDFEIYPNPSSGKVYLILNSDAFELNLKMVLRNSLGQKVFETSLENEITPLEFWDLEGPFWVQVWKKENLIATKKLVLGNW